MQTSTIEKVKDLINKNAPLRYIMKTHNLSSREIMAISSLPIKTKINENSANKRGGKKTILKTSKLRRGTR